MPQRIKYRVAEPDSDAAGLIGAANNPQHYPRYTSPASIAQLYRYERMLQRFAAQHYQHNNQLPIFYS